jgi:hypothetical protein
LIYEAAGGDAPIDQADIIDGCLILSLKDIDLDGRNAPELNVSISRVLVLTQTCDLANRKASTATVAVTLDVQFLVQQNLLKPSDIKGPIRAGRVFGWYLLPASGQHGLPEMVV